LSGNAAFDERADYLPAVIDFLLDRMLRIHPSTGIEPVKIVFVESPEKDQKSLVTIIFAGLKGEFVIGPRRVAEYQFYIAYFLG
jgi:hypothetical protein